MDARDATIGQTVYGIGWYDPHDGNHQLVTGIVVDWPALGAPAIDWQGAGRGRNCNWDAAYATREAALAEADRLSEGHRQRGRRHAEREAREVALRAEARRFAEHLRERGWTIVSEAGRRFAEAIVAEDRHDAMDAFEHAGGDTAATRTALAGYVHTDRPHELLAALPSEAAEGFDDPDALSRAYLAQEGER